MFMHELLKVLANGSNYLKVLLSSSESAPGDSFSSGLLEYPQYTRPADFRGMKVPDILLSGDHGKIDDWRLEQALKRTYERRPDMLTGLS
ncbi:hypothetical protein WP50_25260, partial [Lactiplantibacillus plantarum]